jgi:hypothetical protein
MRLDELGALPPTLDTPQAAELLGCGPDHLWALAREGSAPVEPLRLGRKLRWPTAQLLELLGLGDHLADTLCDSAAGSTPATEPDTTTPTAATTARRSDAA